jgi:hypothetical protein
MKLIVFYEDSPAQGLSEARRGKEFLINFSGADFSSDPPSGGPRRCGGVHPIWDPKVPPHRISEYHDVHDSMFLQNLITENQ